MYMSEATMAQSGWRTLNDVGITRQWARTAVKRERAGDVKRRGVALLRVLCCRQIMPLQALQRTRLGIQILHRRMQREFHSRLR